MPVIKIPLEKKNWESTLKGTNPSTREKHAKCGLFTLNA